MPEQEEEEETESEQEAEAVEDEGEAGSAPRRRAAAGRTGSAPAQLDFPPHQLPEGFRQAPCVEEFIAAVYCICQVCCATWVISARLLLCPGPTPACLPPACPCWHVPLPWPCSWRDLPGVDPSNEASAKRTLLLATVRRFLSLRQEVSPRMTGGSIPPCA